MTIDAMSVTPAAAGSGIIRGILSRLVQKAVRLWQAHLTRQELYGLPDEVLRDIGISRCQINFLALSTDGPDDAR